ncbi:MAG: UPF0149 family protein [Acetobacteraceae bacterium]
MTLDECRAAFAAAETVPVEALRAAVPLAAHLVPEVTALLARAAADEPLLLAEERLATHGLAVLACARRTEVFPALGALIARSRVMWPRVLGSEASLALPPLLTALFDGDAAPLYARLDDEDTPPDLRAALFLTLGWLADAGRTDRAALSGALDRFEAAAVPDDPAWTAWFAAARALGLDAQVEQVRRDMLGVVPAPGFEAEDAQWRDMLDRACAPGAIAVAAPIEDPRAVLDLSPRSAGSGGPMALSPGELDWLDWQLLALATTAAALPLESVDGYFTALHVGSDGEVFDRCEAEIWSGATARDRFVRAAVAETAKELLARYFLAVGARMSDGEPLEPFLEIEDDDAPGRLWASGFLLGMERREAKWERLIRRPVVTELVEPLIRLTSEAGAENDIDFGTEMDTDVLTFAAREAIVQGLPATIRALHRAVRQTPLRPETRVGRNEPCPCGSGRKYKKCCGAPGATARF